MIDIDGLYGAGEEAWFNAYLRYVLLCIRGGKSWIAVIDKIRFDLGPEIESHFPDVLRRLEHAVAVRQHDPIPEGWLVDADEYVAAFSRFIDSKFIPGNGPLAKAMRERLKSILESEHPLLKMVAVEDRDEIAHIIAQSRNTTVDLQND